MHTQDHCEIQRYDADFGERPEKEANGWRILLSTDLRARMTAESDALGADFSEVFS